MILTRSKKRPKLKLKFMVVYMYCFFSKYEIREIFAVVLALATCFGYTVYQVTLEHYDLMNTDKLIGRPIEY